MAQYFLRLWMEERPPIWRVAANILNKQFWTADRWWSSYLGAGGGANTSLLSCYGPFTKKASDGLTFWYNLRNGKGT